MRLHSATTVSTEAHAYSALGAASGQERGHTLSLALVGGSAQVAADLHAYLRAAKAQSRRAEQVYLRAVASG